MKASELFAGRKETLQNAIDLIEDAELLFSSGRYARAFFLAQIATEELGKYVLIVSSAIDAVHGPFSWKQFYQDYRSHKTKTSKLLFFENLYNLINRCGDHILLSEGDKHTATLQEHVKMLSLYCDFDGQGFTVPNEQISDNVATLALKLVKSRLKIVALFEEQVTSVYPFENLTKEHIDRFRQNFFKVDDARKPNSLDVGMSRNMNSIPIASKKRTNYENFVAECPWCGKESIFNRASDLCTFEPIAGRDVTCQSVDCSKPFRIIGDSVNNRHEMLIFDCYDLIVRKYYMNCVLNLAQAYEVFFSLYIRVELLYKPYGAERDQELADLNQISEELHSKIKNYTFTDMQALFLQQVVKRQPLKSLVEAQAVVASIQNRPGVPKDADIESLDDAKLVLLLKALKATSIHKLRNKTIHKYAYRPTREEVEAALKETRSILLPLTTLLHLYDDINWYMKES
jgi:AbiV family abortive infection protein